MTGPANEHESDSVSASLDETRAQLSAGLDKARRLVEQARFMLGGENDESPA